MIKETSKCPDGICKNFAVETYGMYSPMFYCKDCDRNIDLLEIVELLNKKSGGPKNPPEK